MGLYKIKILAVFLMLRWDILNKKEGQELEFQVLRNLRILTICNNLYWDQIIYQVFRVILIIKITLIHQLLNIKNKRKEQRMLTQLIKELGYSNLIWHQVGKINRIFINQTQEWDCKEKK